MTASGKVVLPTLVRVIDGSLDFGARVGSLAIWLISIIVFYDVSMRFLGRPTLWALEISTYLMIVAAVMASGKAVIEDTHFAVRLLPDALAERGRRILDLIVELVCFGLLLFVCHGFFKLLELSIKLEMTSPTLLQVPLWIPQAAILVGFVLMALAFVRKAFYGSAGKR